MLTVCRTPLRVSFFGGGTDYPEYFERTRGAVVGMAIDKYVYVSALRIANTLDYRYRVSYSKIETVSDVEEIAHPVVRAVLKHFEVTSPLDIGVMADLPARSGLGSSSSFTVGLNNLIFHIKGCRVTKLDLARAGVYVERNLLAENVGVQDQCHAGFGGLNRFDFEGKRVRISPVQMTGVTRFASTTLAEQMQSTREGRLDSALSHLLTLTDQAVDVLETESDESMLNDLGAMLHEGWETKKSLSLKISNPVIDALYEAARAAGALGRKPLRRRKRRLPSGARSPSRQAEFKDAMRTVSIVPIAMDTVGSTIVSG